MFVTYLGKEDSGFHDLPWERDSRQAVRRKSDGSSEVVHCPSVQSAKHAPNSDHQRNLEVCTVRKAEGLSTVTAVNCDYC